MKRAGLTNGMLSGISKRVTACVLAVFLLFSLPVYTYATSDPSSSNSVEETKKKLQELRQKRDETQAVLNSQQSGIANLEAGQNALKADLELLEAELAGVSSNITSINEQIQAKEQVIEETQALLDAATEVREEQYESMKQRIRFLFEKREYMITDMLLSSGTLTEFLNHSTYIEAMSAYDRERLDEYQSLEDQIALQKSILESERDQLQVMQDEQTAQQDAYFGMLVATSESIAGYADQISAAELEAANTKMILMQQQAEVSSWEKKLQEQLAISAEAKKGTWTDASGLTFYPNDLRWLANLIYTEAGNQPYEGQVAVGAVVINRMRSSRFKQNIMEDVIKAPWQFAVWPTTLAPAFEQDWAATKSNTCYSAAQDAMNGYSPVGNALFFCTTNIGPSEGIVIGAHIFY